VSTDLVPSLQVLGLGYLAAVLAGLVFGVVLGLGRRVEQACRPLLEFLRAIPGVALLPVFIVLFGLDMEMKVALIATGAVRPVLLTEARAPKPRDVLVADS
jgi:ABC-type nitrate/sulfonate/bicarbonate transport system permease component